ncbi:MAG: hypothetical protein LBC49_04365 [Bacteroidales bacterium]|jgi:phosphopantetheinyl transferase|nr:hypothetical protein [Bacteroidales bacterium]
MSVKLYSAYGEKQVDMSLQASSGGHGNPYLKVASVNEIPPGSVNLLPPEEQQRYGQYKNKNAADLFLLGRILLRNILSENYLLPFDVDIKTDTDGKPYIAQQPPYFSISHSNEKAAVVFAEKPVGIDI